MQLWTNWLEALQFGLEFFSSTVGVSAGVAIVLLTLTLRFVLLPVSWSSAYRGSVHRRKLRKLQPELQRLRERYGKDPAMLTEKTFQLYRDRNLSLIEWRSFLGALAQMPVFLGLFQMLRAGASAGRFLWVSSLSRPDFWLAIIAGITTALMVAASPELPEQARIIMMVLPSVIAIIFALNFASALAVCWITSNIFTAVQTAAVHFVVERRVRNGVIAL